MRCVRFGIYVLCVLAASANADQFCIATAASYYEQVYCQLQARAQTKSLPPFNQFKKNNEQIQYSLLKRPAERNAIKLPAPARSTSPVIEKIPERPAAQARVNIVQTEALNTSLTTIASQANAHGCRLLGNQLKCAAGSYSLIGNKANHRLAATALSAENKMALASYQGGVFNQYLTDAYHQYILKMDEIGLGGVTMTYRKFAYLYQDLQSKGLDFSQRFETMYGFLKKDKAAMGVSESTRVPEGLNANLCSPLAERFYVCDLQGRNYIFALQ